MRALRYTALGQAEVTDLPEPTAGPGQVVLKVEASGICHTDLDILDGHYPARFPVTPGHEFAGTVVATGEGVDAAWSGRRATVDPLVACGTCRGCRRHRVNLCDNLRGFGSEIDGGMAEYAAVDVANLLDVGDLDPALAALSEPLGCAVNGAERSGVGPDDEVLVVGAGPIGLLIATAFGDRGATVEVAEPPDKRRELATSFAASVHTSATDALAARSGEGYDVVVEVTGRPAVAQEAVGAVRRGGTLVLFGVCPPGSELTVDPHEIYKQEITVLGSFSLNRTLPRAVELLRTTTLPLERLVTHRIGLDDLPGAMSLVGGPDSLKVQVAIP